MKLPNWDSITREELLEIYSKDGGPDARIAKMFGVNKSQVAYKRQKLAISHADIIYKKFMSRNDDDWIRLALFLEVNQFYGVDWDKPEIQIDEFDDIARLSLKP